MPVAFYDVAFIGPQESSTPESLFEPVLDSGITLGH